MQLKVTSDGDPAQVQAEGHVTFLATEHEQDPLKALLGPDAFSRRILLDMSRVEFLDSCGIGWLLHCQKQFREAGGKLVMHSVPPVVMQVFRLMRLTTIFNVSSDLHAAQTTFRTEVAS
jgi:anti-anti-sigma factor